MKVFGVAATCGLLAACASAPMRTAPVDIPLPAPPRPLDELVQQLGAADAPSRAAAAWSLAGAGNVDASVLQALRTTLEDPSMPAREAATWALAHVSSPGWRRSQLTSDSPPKILVQTKPVYPRAAFNDRMEGTVLVEILISELGRVSHAEIRRSLPGFDEAALASVRDWQFEPARRGGKPVACVALAPVTFRIY
jgi:TonB family protein